MVVAIWKKQERRKFAWRVCTRTGIVAFIIALSSPSLSLPLLFVFSSPTWLTLPFPLHHSSSPAHPLLHSSRHPVIFPSFEALLAFLGSAPAFGVSAVLPLVGKKMLYSGQKNKGVLGWEAAFDWVLVGAAAAGAVGGLVGVFWR